jgi:3-dehydroquinate synthase
VAEPPRVIRVPGYDVTVGPGLLDSATAAIRAAAPAHRTVVVTDTNVLAHHEAAARRALLPLDAEWLAIPPGEREKSRERWAWLTDRLLDLGCGRDTTVVALGGGVVGDLAGFTAATYMRGVPVVQMPTTLLAMVDASVGGKTAVDVPAGKNLVGAFHRPAAVIADVRLLRTLPIAERRAGVAEMLKHGVVADAAHLAEVVAALPALLDDGRFDEGVAADLVARSVAIKAAVVADDEREAGRRKILNFGHTLGHAIEQASGYALLHGEAVAIGMALEARIAERLGVAAPGTAAAVEAAIRAAGLPLAVPADLDPEDLVRLTYGDKKARAGRVEYALPAAVGRMAGEGSGWGVPVPDDVALAALRTAQPGGPRLA